MTNFMSYTRGCGGSGSAVTRITYPNNDYETFKYDANGNLTLKTDCNGAQIQYAYDALNHLTQKTYPGSSTATFAYDKIGNMTSAVDSDSSISFAYDNLYRMTSTTQQLDSNPSKTIDYEYDPVGNRTAMTGPNDIANAYTYTLVNQVASITDVYNNATNYYYDDGGRLTLRTYGNGTKAEYSYDEANRLTLRANKKSDDSMLSSFEYETDKTGSRTKRTTGGSAMTAQALKYTYDNIYEINEVYRLEPNPAVLETFSYDGVGNRTADTDYSNYSYNTNNQLTSYDSITFVYDNNGNLTKKTQNGTDDTTYTFDYENKITRIDYPDETYSAYKYDALGRRVEKRDRSGNIARYVYDGQNFIAEYDGSNSLVASYLQSFGIDRPISMFRAGQMYWYHSDALGSIYQMTDSNQAVARSYDYSAFGKIISESGSLVNPFTYTAREYDSDSGLYYYRARYYDAGVGRFLSRDPIKSKKVAAYGRLYLYVLNDPINNTDPRGLDDQAFLVCVDRGTYEICMECYCSELLGFTPKGIYEAVIRPDGTCTCICEYDPECQYEGERAYSVGSCTTFIIAK
ncbi:RHS repeat protein [Candidatus Poribacteria bacterium]|nr:RHS repeat protein [Candidatus Poribacteria bacterium]